MAVIKKRMRRVKPKNGASACAPLNEKYHLASTVPGIMEAKTNLNFLERPLFLSARKLPDDATGEMLPLDKCRIYSDGNGFDMQALSNKELSKKGLPTFYGLPGFFDKKVLYGLASRLPVFTIPLEEAGSLLTSAHEDLRSVEITSVRAFLKEMGSSTSGTAMQQVKNSLLRWNHLILSYHNNSITVSKTPDGEVLRTVVSSDRLRVIDRVDFDEQDGQLTRIKVVFNRDFILCNSDNFSRSINVNVFYRFTSPSAARLWELLSKSMYGTAGRRICQTTGAMVWDIGMDKLLPKLGTQRTHHATDTLLNAVKEINTVDPATVYTLTFRDGAQGQPIAEFRSHKTSALTGE